MAEGVYLLQQLLEPALHGPVVPLLLQELDHVIALEAGAASVSIQRAPSLICQGGCCAGRGGR